MKVKIDYTNWKGERSTREIIPIRMFWGENEYHIGFQWLLEAYDVTKDSARIFAMKYIHSWE